MTSFKQVFLREWYRVPPGEFQTQITHFLSLKPGWLTGHQNVFENPELQEARPMGMHGTTAPLMQYRGCTVDGRRIFLFEEDLRDLLS